jgi:hypothetical protein
MGGRRFVVVNGYGDRESEDSIRPHLDSLFSPDNGVCKASGGDVCAADRGKRMGSIRSGCFFYSFFPNSVASRDSYVQMGNASSVDVHEYALCVFSAPSFWTTGHIVGRLSLSPF